MTPASRVRYATPSGQKGANGLGFWLRANPVQPETKRMSAHPPRRLCWVLMVATVLTIFVASTAIQAQSTMTMPDFGALRMSFDSSGPKQRPPLNLFRIPDQTLLSGQEESRRDLFGVFESLRKPYSANDSFLRDYKRSLYFYGPRPQRTYRNPEFWRNLSLAPYPGYLLNIAAEGRRRIAQGQNRNR